MGCLAKFLLRFVFPLLILPHSLAGTTVTPYLNPGFHFDYTKPNQALTIPVTSQCERIHLQWTRDANNTGPLPVAPYFLQVYHSASSTPYFVQAGFGPSFDWDVPFAPNTLYQICMFDINGVSGGCQQTYSMIANSTVDKPSCQNVTAPSALSVSAKVPTGQMSLYSYIDQCKSLSVTPSSGTPPFTLTIAPSNHPPYNVTSKTADAIYWQVSLPLGFKFYISLESSDGLMWASGPLVVGGSGQDACLAPGSMSKSEFKKLLIGSTIGSIIFGIAVGIFGWVVFHRLRRRGRAPSQAYFASQFSRDSSSRALKAASSFAATFMSPSSSLAPTSPTLLSIPLTTATPATSSDLPDTPPSRNQTPPRRPGRSHLIVEPYVTPPSEGSSRSDPSRNQYPPDVKRPLPSPPPPADISVVSRDDTSSFTSSSTNSRSNSQSRPLSVQSRAPTYVPRSTPLRGAVNTINETDIPDLPPEYAHHTTNPSLTYAPSVLSSGNKF